jgi:hypothetical protein
MNSVIKYPALNMCFDGTNSEAVNRAAEDKAHVYRHSNTARGVTTRKFNKTVRLLSTVFVVRKLSMGQIIWYLSLNIIGKKNILKSNVFTGTRNQDRFLGYDFRSYNHLSEEDSFYLGVILLSYSVSKLQKRSYWDLNALQI